MCTVVLYAVIMYSILTPQEEKKQQFHRNCFYMHDRIIWNSQIKMKKIISLLGEQMHRGFMIVILFLVLYGQGTDNNNNNKKA